MVGCSNNLALSQTIPYASEKYKVSYRKYPEPREVYSFKVGRRAEEKIRDIAEKKLDLVAKPHLVNDKGADIVFPEIDTAIEVWDWSRPHCYSERTKSVLENLRPFEHRGLIASFLSPKDKEKIEGYFKDNPVIVRVTGFEWMPREYYSFYSLKNDTEGKKFDNKRTQKIVNNIISSLIHDLFPFYPVIEYNHKPKDRTRLLIVLECYIEGRCDECKDKCKCYNQIDQNGSCYVYNTPRTRCTYLNKVYSCSGCGNKRSEDNKNRPGKEGSIENKGNMPRDSGSPREGNDIGNNSPREGTECKENIQTTLVKSSRATRLKERIRNLVPSCYNCKQKQDCNILKEEEKIKCLKRRVFQFIRGYNTFSINREDPLLEIGIDAFWQNIREKKSMDLNRRNSGDQSTQERIDSYG
jgi:hypothetical protein